MLYLHECGIRDPGTIAMGKKKAAYVCDSCGEEIVVPLDPWAGPPTSATSRTVPVCCHPNVLSIEFDEDGDVRVSSESE